MINFIQVVIAIGLMIAVHEFGHFVAALKAGVKVYKFSIGFGPKLLSFTKNNIQYRLGAIPIGGYVKMKGENPDEVTNDPDEFQNQKWWKKIIIAFAGPFANLILAFLLLSFTFIIGRHFTDQKPIIGKIEPEYKRVFNVGDKIISVNGKHVQGWSQIANKTKSDKINNYTVKRNEEMKKVTLDNIEPMDWYKNIMPEAKPVIGEVAPNLPAYQAGLLPGDIIKKIDGKPINSWYELRESIINNKNDKIKVEIQRNEQNLSKVINLQKNILQDDHKMIGITQKMPIEYTERYNLIESFKYGALTTTSVIIANYYGLYKLILKPGEIKKNIGSPIMIFSLAKSSAEKGFTEFLALIAAISIILMIMNLLPIPVLDGGHIIFALIEGIIHKKPSMKIRILAQNIGIILILLITFFGFYNDIENIIKRRLSFKQEQTTENSTIKPE